MRKEEKMKTFTSYPPVEIVPFQRDRSLLEEQNLVPWCTMDQYLKNLDDASTSRISWDEWKSRCDGMNRRTSYAEIAARMNWDLTPYIKSAQLRHPNDPLLKEV